MKDLMNVKEYSREYDDGLNAELEIVKNAYKGFGPLFSIKIPNELTEMELYQGMSGDQPSYPNKQVGILLKEKDLIWDRGVSDYPRHGNTQRLFWNDLEKAQAALYFIKQLKKNRDRQTLSKVADLLATAND